MPQHITIVPGTTGNFGATTIAANATVQAPFAGTFTASIGGAAVVPYALGPGGVAVLVVNGATLSVTNTTAGVLHPPAGNVIVSF